MFANLATQRDTYGKVVRYHSAFAAGFNPLLSGLVLHLPLSEYTATAATGQTLNYNGTPGYGTVGGIPCGYFSGSNILSTYENSDITGAASRTVSFWALPDTTQTYCNAVGMGASQTTGFMFNCGARINETGGVNVQFTTWGNDVDDFRLSNDSLLHHYCYVYDVNTPGELIIYVDGVPASYAVSGINTQNSPFYLGRSGGGEWRYSGYLAAARVYNRALKPYEVSTLSQEF